MPSLQFDLPVALGADAKRCLARAAGEVYSRVMQVEPDIVTVVVRAGDGVWRCTPAEPVPACLIMCDVRRGRDRDTRGRLARGLIEICAFVTGLPADVVKVEFTQHDGDEMFHPQLGGFNRDWQGPEQP